MALADISILHLFIGSVPGGVLRYVVDISVALRERGVDVVLAGQRGDWHKLVEQAQLRWLEIPIRGGIFDLWRSAKIIARELGDRPGMVIHAHHRRATLVGRLLQGRALKHRSPVPLLYTLHMPFIPMGALRRQLTVVGDVTHVASQGAKRWLIERRLQREERIAVIPHGVDPQRFAEPTPQQRLAARSRLGVDVDQPIAAFVGRFDDPKNESWVVDVAQTLQKAGMPGRILLAGDGPRRADLEQHIVDAEVGHRVSLLGDCDPVPLYHAADVLLSPSRIEGFSYVCAEAMSCGVPVLRTRTAGTEEMIIENVTGRSCAIDHDAFIAAAVDMLSLPRSRLQEMGQAAAGHIRQNLRFDQQVARTVELYRRLVGRSAQTQ